MAAIGGQSSTTLTEILGVKSSILSLMAFPSIFPQYSTIIVYNKFKYVQQLQVEVKG